jgi:hypothetical protein
MVVAWKEITESADWEVLFTDEQVQVVGDGPKQPAYRAPAVLQSHPRHLIPARIQAFARERPGTPGSVSSGSENQGIKGGGLIQTSHTNSRFLSDFCLPAQNLLTSVDLVGPVMAHERAVVVLFFYLLLLSE